MEPPCPEYILKKSSASVMDLFFWDTTYTVETPQPSSKTNQFLIAGYGDNGGVDIWDLISRRVKTNFHSDHGITSVYGTNKGEVLYLNRHGELKVFDLYCTKPKLIVEVPNVAFCKMSCLEEGNGLTCAVTGQEESSIHVWNLKTAQTVSMLHPELNTKLGMVMSIKIFKCYNSDSALCIGGYESGRLVLWNVAQEIVLHHIELFAMEPIMCFDFTESTMSGVAGSPSEFLKKFVICEDDHGNFEIKVSKVVEMINSGISDVKIRSDDKIVAASGWHDGSVRIFSFKSLKSLALLNYHDGTVQSVTFRKHVDKKYRILASGSLNHKIAVWKIYND